MLISVESSRFLHSEVLKPAVFDEPISDQDLLGYLLNALPAEEMDRIRACVEQDVTLQDRLKQVKRRSILLNQDSGPYEPSGDLVERTMARIPAWSDCPNEAALEKSASNPAGREAQWLASSTEPWSGKPASPLDMIVSMAVAAIFLGLLAPNVLGVRETARQLQCMENLRSLGNSFMAFSNLGSHRQLPCPDLNGPLAFAGVYAPILAESNLIDRPNELRCPSISGPGVLCFIPSTEQIRKAHPSQLHWIQRSVGGDYAYHLGNIRSGRFVGAENIARHDFVIMGDAPILRGNRESWLLHGGRLVNLLYEDGHVTHLRLDKRFGLPDHPYQNHHGIHEAGLNANDSSLGASAVPPFRWSEQR